MGRPDLLRRSGASSPTARRARSACTRPGCARVDDFRRVVEAVAPSPVNALVNSDFTTVAELAAVGVRRISVGGALARTAWTGFLAAAREIKEQGTFTALGRAIGSSQLEPLLDDPRG